MRGAAELRSTGRLLSEVEGGRPSPRGLWQVATAETWQAASLQRGGVQSMSPYEEKGRPQTPSE
jgi:hypothetical protein